MIEPSIDLQTGIRSNLTASANLTALVAPDSIFDGRARPEEFPCIIIGEGQTVLETATFNRKHVRAYLRAHVWTKESGLADVKTIAGEVASALTLAPSLQQHALIDFMVTGTNYMRDPANEYGHAIVQIEALIGINP